MFICGFLVLCIKKKYLRASFKSYVFGSQKKHFVVYSTFTSSCASIRNDVFEVLYSNKNGGCVLLLVEAYSLKQKEYACMYFLMMRLLAIQTSYVQNFSWN